MQLVFHLFKVQGTSFSYPSFVSLVSPPVIPYHMSIHALLSAFFRSFKKKKRKRWLNSSNPFLASHFLSVNQGESFLTFLPCCEGQMCPCEYKGFIHGYLWPRGLGSSPTYLTEIQFQPLPCCVSFSKLLTFSVPQFPKWKMEIIKVCKSWGCLLMVTWDNSCVLWSEYMLKTVPVLSPQQVLAMFWAPSRC